MNHTKILIISLLLFLSTMFCMANSEKGSQVFTFYFNNLNYRKEWSSIPTAQWVHQSITNTTCLFVNETGTVFTTINLIPYRGMRLQFRCKAKAENVTKPSEVYMGVKYMLHFKSSTGEVWKNENNVFGTFDWKELSFIINIPYDVTDGKLSLGLQGSTGKVWFDSLSVKVINSPNLNSIPNKGKLEAVTRFRGVMSPLVFIPKDFHDLGLGWGANLIRWQLFMSYSETKAVGTDLEKYDAWLNGKLNQLDSVLITCKQNGIRVVIDLHSLPGGSDGDGTKLFYNKQLNEYL